MVTVIAMLMVARCMPGMAVPRFVMVAMGMATVVAGMAVGGEPALPMVALLVPALLRGRGTAARILATAMMAVVARGLILHHISLRDAVRAGSSRGTASRRGQQSRTHRTRYHRFECLQHPQISLLDLMGVS